MPRTCYGNNMGQVACRITSLYENKFCNDLPPRLTSPRQTRRARGRDTAMHTNKMHGTRCETACRGSAVDTRASYPSHSQRSTHTTDMPRIIDSRMPITPHAVTRMITHRGSGGVCSSVRPCGRCWFSSTSASKTRRCCAWSSTSSTR